MGFDLVAKVKSVVTDLVLLIFTHQSCAQLDNMLVASWSRTLAVVAYYSVLHRTKSSANIAHFTGDGHFLIKSLMTPPCGTLCLRSILLLFVLSMTTLARRVCRYDLIQQNIFPAMLHFFSFRCRPSVQTVSNAFCRSIHTVRVCFLCWNPSSFSCARYVVWSSVQWCSWKPACSEASKFSDSRNHLNLVLITLPSTLTMQRVRLIVQ